MSEEEKKYSEAMSEDKTINSEVMPQENSDQMEDSNDLNEESEAKPGHNEEEDGECLELQADFENDDEYYKSIFPNESPKHCSSSKEPTNQAEELPAIAEIEKKMKNLSSERSVEEYFH